MLSSLSLLLACSFYSFFSLALPSHSLHHRSSSFPRIITYYPDWAPPPSTDYTLYDVVIFAFALPDQNFQLAWDNEQAPTLLSNVVSAAHASATLVMLSVGGWSGSRYFSEAVGTPQNRAIFVDNIVDTYNRFDLDGIDIDWEYPGQLSSQGNSENSADSANMLEFFRLLQQKLPPRALISAAVQDSTFAGSDGHPMKDVSAFSHFVDWVTLMNYDNYETRQPPGPNAALYDGCDNSAQPAQNAVSAYRAWTDAGFPASKIVLGVPAYGYIVDSGVHSVSERSLRASAEDATGQILFRSLIDQGILQQAQNGSFVASGGFTREWDRCSATPFLRSQSAGQVIPYDDPESLGIKAAWVRKMKMGGVNMFAIDGDTSQYHLTKSMRANLFPGTSVGPASSLSSSSVLVLSPSTPPSGSSTSTLWSSTLLSGADPTLPNTALSSGPTSIPLAPSSDTKPGLVSRRS